jgi:hypothetical protein
VLHLLLLPPPPPLPPPPLLLPPPPAAAAAAAASAAAAAAAAAAATAAAAAADDNDDVIATHYRSPPAHQSCGTIRQAASAERSLEAQPAPGRSVKCHPTQPRKTWSSKKENPVVFLASPFDWLLKTEHLPSQARDKHSEHHSNETRFAQPLRLNAHRVWEDRGYGNAQ